MSKRLSDSSKSVQNLIGSIGRVFNPDTVDSVLQEIEEDETQDKGGEKHFHLAKIYLNKYLEERKAKEDTSFALLAWKNFQEAKERGCQNIKPDRHLQPIKDLAKSFYDKALLIYLEKKQSKFLEVAVANLKTSIAFGGLPDGLVEGALAKLYVDLGKNELAYENFEKAVKLGKKLSEADEKFIHEYEMNTPHILAAKTAKELYHKAKILYFEKKDEQGAFDAMKESIRLDPNSGGEKEYQLAKLYLDTHNRIGAVEKDAKYASFALEWFQKAVANGRFVDEDKFLKPIKALAASHFEMALHVYKKKEGKYLENAASLLRKSLSFGVVPGGEVEYLMARVHFDSGKKDLAYEYLQKATMLGKEINQEDHAFLDIYEAKIEPMLENGFQIERKTSDTTPIVSPTSPTSPTDPKKLALQYFEKSKKLIQDQEYIVAIDAMTESVKLDEGEGGEKQYSLAKLYLACYLLEGRKKDDVSYAILAHAWFEIAIEKGKKNMDQKNLQTLKDMAKSQFDKGLQIYQEKQEDYKEIAASYMLKSISLGGVPGGEADYYLSLIYAESGKEQLSKDHLAKAVENGKLLDEKRPDIPANLADLVKLKSHIVAVKTSLQEAEKKLEHEKDKAERLRGTISKKLYDTQMAKLEKEGQDFKQRLLTLEDQFELAKQEKDSFECHTACMKSVGVPGKVILDLACKVKVAELQDDCTRLFWMRKLGDFE